MTTKDFKTVGLTFVDDYPTNLLRLQERIEGLQHDAIRAGQDPPRIPVRLVRNPDNEHDPNAVQVHVPLVGRRSMVGHVPADLAARLAPSMDEGHEWLASVEHVLIQPQHPDRPGLSVLIERVD